MQALRRFCALDGGPHGEPSRPLQRHRRRWSWRGSASPTRTSSRATGSPSRCPTRNRPCRPAASSTSKLTGANPIDVLVEFPPGQTLYSPETLAVIAAVHKHRREAGGPRQCLVARDAAALAGREGGRRQTSATLKQYVGFLPKYLVHRFVDEKQDAVLVSGRIPDKDASSCCRSWTTSTTASTPCGPRIPATRSR